MTRVLILIIALPAIGVLLRRLNVLRSEDSAPLNRILINVALPPLVFTGMANAKLGWDMAIPSATCVGTVLLGLVLTRVVAKRLDLTPSQTGSLLLAACLGNTTLIGYPVVTALFGEAALPYAIFFDQAGTHPIAIALGPMIAARFGCRREGPSALTRLMRFPLAWGFVLGILFNLTSPSPLPALARSVLDSVALMAVPLMLVTFGLMLRPPPSGRRPRLGALSWAVVCKLAILPIAGWAAGRALGLPDTALGVSVVQAGMPSMMLTIVFAAEFELDVELSVVTVFVSTLGALMTIPALYSLVR